MNMDWVKVMPETMPKEGQGVILTYIDSAGKKYIEVDALFENGKFKAYSEAWDMYIERDDKVTHWMPLPEPADD